MSMVSGYRWYSHFGSAGSASSEVLGHASTNITVDTYGHGAQQAKLAALDVIAGALEMD